MKEIQSNEDFQEWIGKGRVVVEFYTTWCPDCTFVEPYLPEWEEKFHNQFTMIRADRDALPDIAEQLTVLGIPTFIAFDGGKEVARLVSRDTKSKAAVESFLASAY